jgi:hypothetical protein
MIETKVDMMVIDKTEDPETTKEEAEAEVMMIAVIIKNVEEKDLDHVNTHQEINTEAEVEIVIMVDKGIAARDHAPLVLDLQENQNHLKILMITKIVIIVVEEEVYHIIK